MAGKVGKCVVHVVRDFAEEHPLIHPQQVASAPDHSRCTQDAVHSSCLKRPAQYQKFADETIKQGKSDGRQHHEQKERRVDWHRRSQTTKLTNFIGMPPLVNDPCQHEEGAGRDTVSQHHELRAIQTGCGEAEYTEDDEPKVADRRISDQLFHIGLNHGHECAVDDADQCQNHDPWSVVP